MEAIREQSSGKLALPAAQGVSLREFLLENLNKHKNMTEAANALGVSATRIRIDMSRARVVEVRKYLREGNRKGTPLLVVTYLPEEAVLA